MIWVSRLADVEATGGCFQVVLKGHPDDFALAVVLEDEAAVGAVFGFELDFLDGA